MGEKTTVGAAESISVTHVYGKLPAQEVGRARAFYAEKLGLEPYVEVHNHLHYEVAGVHFIVFPSTGAPSGTHDQLGFAVDDVRSEVSRLEGRGVVFEHFPPPPGASVDGDVVDMGTVRAAWFKDSEGNLISIAEFVSGSPFSN